MAKMQKLMDTKLEKVREVVTIKSSPTLQKSDQKQTGQHVLSLMLALMLSASWMTTESNFPELQLGGRRLRSC